MTLLQLLISEYTREAGLRNLEREIANICRKVARKVAEGAKGKTVVGREAVDEFLGPMKYFRDVAERTMVPGVATGVAWTEAGGDIIFVETSMMKGGKSLMLTGQLGEVMQESAQAALTYIRANADDAEGGRDFYEKHDLHVHVPHGGVPKDGPSAGVDHRDQHAIASDRQAREVGRRHDRRDHLEGQGPPVGGSKRRYSPQGAPASRSHSSQAEREGPDRSTGHRQEGNRVHVRRQSRRGLRERAHRLASPGRAALKEPQDRQPVRCWEEIACGRPDCEAHDAENSPCWLLPENRCFDRPTCLTERLAIKCAACPVFLAHCARAGGQRASDGAVVGTMEGLLDECAELLSGTETLRADLRNKSAEVTLLGEVGRALQSTMELDQLLLVILTAVTAGDGLGFNRAFLIMLDEESGRLEGRMAVGPFASRRGRVHMGRHEG